MAGMRRLYETPADRGREHSLSLLAAEKFNCTFQSLPPKSQLDFTLISGGTVVGFAEVKCRRNPMTKYPTYMLSLEKVVKAHAIHDATGLPCFLIVGWTDRWGWRSLHERHDGDFCMYGGRVDRKDDQDMEPVVHMPISSFRQYRLTAPQQTAAGTHSPYSEAAASAHPDA